MNPKSYLFIESEFRFAGIDTTQCQLMEQLEKRRITRDKDIPPIEFLFTMFDTPCFPRGELVAITGKHKSGKTLVCSVLMALACTDQSLAFKRLSPHPLHILWIDTEQSDTSTQDILRERLAVMVGNDDFPDDMYDIFNLRIDNWQDRMPLVECAIQKCKPDLMIFDGVRDVIGNINDYEAAQDIVEHLLHLVAESNCCMVCVLHENKALDDKTLRGAIGSELQNKCFEQYEASKSEDRIFSFTQTHTRKHDIDQVMKFTVGDDGLPKLCNIPDFVQNTESPNSNNQLISDVDIATMYKHIFDGILTLRRSDLQLRVAEYLHDGRAHRFELIRKKGLELHIIERIQLNRRTVFYKLAGTQIPENLSLIMDDDDE